MISKVCYLLPIFVPFLVAFVSLVAFNNLSGRARGVLFTFCSLPSCLLVPFSLPSASTQATYGLTLTENCWSVGVVHSCARREGNFSTPGKQNIKKKENKQNIVRYPRCDFPGRGLRFHQLLVENLLTLSFLGVAQQISVAKSIARLPLISFSNHQRRKKQKKRLHFTHKLSLPDLRCLRKYHHFLKNRLPTWVFDRL